MKNNEINIKDVIADLDDLCKRLQDNYNDGIPFEQTEEDRLAVYNAIELLAKLTPKQPDLEGDGYDDNGELIYDTWICPNCEEHYEVDYDIYEHCPKCGQAIDRGGME